MNRSDAVARAMSCCLLAALLFPPDLVAAQSGTTATGTSNKLNPAISLNSLFLARKGDESSESDGFRAQEFEMTVVSIVDSYFRASASIGFEPAGSHVAHAHDELAQDGEEGDELAIEEGYVSTLGLPAGFGLKAGKFLLPLGRHNQLHTHQYPFITPPRPVANVLGEHSIGDVGLLGSYLPELPWYVDFQAYVTNASAEPFDHESKRMAAGGRVESLFELGESATVELGGSTFVGPGEDESDRTFVGADLRFKWRDNRKTHGRAVNWVTEFLAEQSGDPTVTGVYSTLLMRVSRQWWTGVEYGWTIFDGGANASREHEQEARLQIAWVPGEFSALRAEFGWVDPVLEKRELSASLQLNFTIGAHSAHRY